MGFELSGLPGSWGVRRLEDCVEQRSVTYGIVQPGANEPAGIPMLRVNNFSQGTLRLDDVLRVSPEVESKYSRTRLRGGEVLLTLVGSVGQVAIAPSCVQGWNVARAVGVMRPVGEIGARWLSICLRSPESQRILGLGANTTVQTTVNLKDVKALPIPIPPRAEREAIEQVISALDDKITLLRETNASLEAIAQAIFKSWFVDFDPVRAKAEGRDPEGVPPEVADLFPSEFEDSELGAIPKGWRIVRIGELLELAYGKALKATDRTPGEVPVYGSGGINGTHNRALIDHPTVIVGRKGTVGSLYWEDRPCFPIDTVFFVNPMLASLEFCYRLLLAQPLRDMNTDAAVPGLNRENVYRLKVCLPDQSTMDAFDDIVDSLRNRMQAIRDEIEGFASLRDTLLPRLMSGKLRIPDLVVSAPTE